MHDRRRPAKVLVDWLQSDPAPQTVAAWSLRATAWPTVSYPLTWEQVEAARSAADLTFTAEDALSAARVRAGRAPRAPGRPAG